MPLYFRQISRLNEAKGPHHDEISTYHDSLDSKKKESKKCHRCFIVTSLRLIFPIFALMFVVQTSHRKFFNVTSFPVKRRLRVTAPSGVMERQSSNGTSSDVTQGKSKVHLQLPSFSKSIAFEIQDTNATDFITKLLAKSRPKISARVRNVTSNNHVIAKGIATSDNMKDSTLQNSNQPISSFIASEGNTAVKRDLISPAYNYSENLKLAMLISFPNSGTSYTLSAVRESSEHHVGSTSCLPKKKEKKYTPVYNNISQHGPHFTPASSRRMKQLLRPHKYILTKTHCDGYDNAPEPSPWNYIITQKDFARGCRRVCSPVPSNSTSESTTTWESFYFDESLIGTFVHLFRDPFDNIVSRWHNHMSHAPTKYPEEVGKWENSAAGFQAFCRSRDDHHQFHEAPHLPSELVKATQGVPCRTDFIRYVQWHNHAFRMTKMLEKPVHIVHYFDYRDDMNGTMTKLLNFLELPFVSDGLDFSWKNYSEYYTDDQRRATKNFVNLYASPELKRELKLYGF